MIRYKTSYLKDKGKRIRDKPVVVTVIVNRRTAVFVTRTKHVLVARAAIRDGPQPKP